MTMRAVLFESPGTVLLIDDAPRPALEEGEVVIRCTHLGLCGSNTGPYLGEGRWEAPPWPHAPGWMGHENVGIIEESQCPEWPIGTRVVAHPRSYNGFVDVITARYDAMARIPDDAEDLGGFIIAQPLATVLRALAITEPVIGQRCVVIGAGSIGLLFTWALRRMGASQVIGVDTVPWRLEWATRFGATEVIDASSADTISAVRDLTGGQMADYAVDAGTTTESLITAAMLPRHGGRLQVFGVPRHELQPFPWFHSLHNETKVLTSHGPGLLRYLQPAVDLVAGDWHELASLVTPRMPMARAAEAFDMYANPAAWPGCLKLVLET